MSKENNTKKYPYIEGGRWTDISRYILIDKTTFKFTGIKCPRCGHHFAETREHVSMECEDCGLVVSNVGDGTLYLCESSARTKAAMAEKAVKRVREKDNKEAKNFAYKLFARMIHEKVEQIRKFNANVVIN